MSLGGLFVILWLQGIRAIRKIVGISRLPSVTSALAGFIICAVSGAIFGYGLGVLTGFAIWHH